MKKLMKLSCFIEKIQDYVAESHNYQRGFELIVNYKDFLKQPLGLWMFVPCDENGDVMEEPVLNPICCRKPNDDGRGYPECCGIPYPDYDTIEWSQYFKTKERCLFEGCVYDAEMDAVRNENGIMIYSVKYKHEINDTIEDLVKYDIELTSTAQKQLSYE